MGVGCCRVGVRAEIFKRAVAARRGDGQREGSDRGLTGSNRRSFGRGPKADDRQVRGPPTGSFVPRCRTVLRLCPASVFCENATLNRAEDRTGKGCLLLGAVAFRPVILASRRVGFGWRFDRNQNRGGEHNAADRAGWPPPPALLHGTVNSCLASTLPGATSSSV